MKNVHMIPSTRLLMYEIIITMFVSQYLNLNFGKKYILQTSFLDFVSDSEVSHTSELNALANVLNTLSRASGISHLNKHEGHYQFSNNFIKV